MKDFLLIANQNAIIYKEFFHLLKEWKVRPGYRPFNKDFYFDLNDNDKERITKEKKEGSGWKIVDGEICGRLANVCWFTTLPVKRNRTLVLTKNYDPELYQKYDHYDAINVNKVKDIPFDYDGVMGVPITIFQYDLDNVEVMDARAYAYNDKQRGKSTYLIKDADSSINGKPTYARVPIRLIRKKQL